MLLSLTPAVLTPLFPVLVPFTASRSLVKPMASVAVQTGKLQPIYIAEVLALVFSHLDNRSIARAARVCKQWSDVALDTLWHVVTDFKPLLSLLAPITTFENRGHSQGPISFMVSQPGLCDGDTAV